MTRHRLLVVILGVLGTVVAPAIGAVMLVVMLDWRPRIERYASEALDRKLSIAGLTIGWGNPLALELKDVRLANAAWGSKPDMLRIEGLSALIDVPALLRGVLRFERLQLDKPALLLERDGEGRGNWHFKEGAAPAGLAIVPKNRTQFPVLLDMALRDGEFIYRATASDLRIGFHDLAIRSAGDDQPVALTVSGAYNDVPTRLEATTDSYAALRDATIPFGAKFSLAAAATTIGFTGTMSEPIDFEGVRGKINIETKKLGDFLRMLGAELHADFPLAIAGAFTREGDHWRIAEAKGKLAANGFDGTVSLDEGPRAKPDDLAATLHFAQLDLAPLVGGAGKNETVSLQLEKNPAINLDARVTAKQLTYETRRLADFAIAAKKRAGQIAVSALSFAFAGGKVDIAGTARSVAAGSHLTLTAGLTGADADRVAQAADAGPGQIAGRVDGRLMLEMTGATLAEALKTSRGQAVLGMVEGHVARDLVERASTICAPSSVREKAGRG